MSVSGIVTDIEGTTTSISFVYDILFPYARSHLSDFVMAHHGRESVVKILEEIQEISGASEPKAAVDVLLGWMDADRKVTPLKSLQGMIWRDAYESGKIKGHVYPDAYKELAGWRDDGKILAVYSSGSVAAQKLLFGYSDFGDMRPLFRDYFDTTTGPKKEAQSYGEIAAALGEDAGSLLFLSDAEAELDAAFEAGFQVVQLIREPSMTPSSKYRWVGSFSDIELP